VVVAVAGVLAVVELWSRTSARGERHEVAVTSLSCWRYAMAVVSGRGGGDGDLASGAVVAELLPAPMRGSW
jgi:hypothetical protein